MAVLVTGVPPSLDLRGLMRVPAEEHRLEGHRPHGRHASSAMPDDGACAQARTSPKQGNKT